MLVNNLLSAVQTIGSDINTVNGKLPPAGGNYLQFLVKNSNADHDFQYIQLELLPQMLFIQGTEPTVNYPFVWYKVDETTGELLDILYEADPGTFMTFPTDFQTGV